MRHAVFLIQDYLRRDTSNRSSGGHHDEALKNRNCRLTGKNQERSPAEVRVFAPPDIAAVHQGSAAIDSLADLSAQGSGSCGIRV